MLWRPATSDDLVLVFNVTGRFVVFTHGLNADMSARVKRNVHVLHALAHCHPSVTKCIIQGADRDLTDCIGECAHNILKGNITLKPSEKACLTKYKLILRKIASRRATLKSRKKVLQTGGFLPALLGPLLGSVIIPLAKKAVGGIISAVKKRKK